ncbi:hypothetical protein L6452_31848 [Arctium lappa]|uniref:Uncharacterized protein n=1 Tax=Arctium lappa TaxID=4217 RepID=A0ACB8Z431_ARCLA|nr:hypothetical protein L6452_31848 [Arctium lappa]
MILTEYSAKLLKKPDQCRAVYACSHLFWVDNEDGVKDGERVFLCLKRVLGIANVAQKMVNVTKGSNGSVMFFEILNNTIRYIQSQKEKDKGGAQSGRNLRRSSVIGSPTEDSWAEGLELASTINYQFQEPLNPGAPFRMRNFEGPAVSQPAQSRFQFSFQHLLFNSFSRIEHSRSCKLLGNVLISRVPPATRMAAKNQLTNEVVIHNPLSRVPPATPMAVAARNQIADHEKVSKMRSITPPASSIGKQFLNSKINGSKSFTTVKAEYRNPFETTGKDQILPDPLHAQTNRSRAHTDL